MTSLPKPNHTPDPQECPKICFPRPDSPDPDEKQVDIRPSDDKFDDDPAEAIARQFNMDKDKFASLDFEKDLSNVTCDCGHGYFKPDKTWVSGAEVRAGQAPPKPLEWS